MKNFYISEEFFFYVEEHIESLVINEIKQRMFE